MNLKPLTTLGQYLQTIYPLSILSQAELSEVIKIGESTLGIKITSGPWIVDFGITNNFILKGLCVLDTPDEEIDPNGEMLTFKQVAMLINSVTVVSGSRKLVDLPAASATKLHELNRQ